MAQCTTRWFLSLQITLYLFLIFVQGNEDAEDAYKNDKNLVLEYFLPINLPAVVNGPLRREKRDVEGSGEDESTFSELKENDNSTRNAFAIALEKEPFSNLTLEEGSGEVDESSEEQSSVATIIDDSEVLTTSEQTVTENQSEVLTSTEMIFDRSEDFGEATTEEPTTTAESTTVRNREVATTTEDLETTTPEKETTTEKSTTEEISTVWTTTDSMVVHENTPDTTQNIPTKYETTILPEVSEDGQTVIDATTTVRVIEENTTVPIIVPHDIPTQTVIDEITTQEIPTAVPIVPETSTQTVINISTPVWVTTPKFMGPMLVPIMTEGLPTPEKPPTTPEPVVEEIFKETRMDEKLEASPGNILQKENLSLGADPLLITNTRLIDSEETVQLSSSEPKRLGAYIVIGLILLSFSSLVGYITFRKRMNRKRQEFESNQESNDTEKALLSLSDYKDGSELEENHLKNNEITPIVVKSNSQINRFEKNTNFSSPKNLNTIANEKNIEKDNVLKSTAENLTQVIIENSPKEVEENVPSMEKLIVKTRIDQDSIPKKPIIINRSSTGYMPIPQDNS